MHLIVKTDEYEKKIDLLTSDFFLLPTSKQKILAMYS